jgi:hypothetical protein
MCRLSAALGLLIFVAGGSAASAQAIYKQEPAPGEIRAGHKVLVDDGRCPKGQIKEVTGGTRVHGQPGVQRVRTCIPRPK